MVAFLGLLLLVAIAAAIISKVSGILALVVTAAWLLGVENAHQYVALLWWTFGISTAIAMVGAFAAAYFSGE